MRGGPIRTKLGTGSWLSNYRKQSDFAKRRRNFLALSTENAVGLSIRAYARHRGVSHVAVLRAIKAGRIPKEPDGTIDRAKADAAWDRSTSPGRQKAPAPKLQPVPDAALDSVQDILTEEGLPADGDVTFVQARTAHEIAKAHLARLRLQRHEGRVRR